MSDRNPRDALEVLWLPGHCPDELALYDPLDRRLYVGDIIYRSVAAPSLEQKPREKNEVRDDKINGVKYFKEVGTHFLGL